MYVLYCTVNLGPRKGNGNDLSVPMGPLAMARRSQWVQGPRGPSQKSPSAQRKPSSITTQKRIFDVPLFHYCTVITFYERLLKANRFDYTLTTSGNPVEETWGLGPDNHK